MALLRPILCGAGAELVHVPVAHSERHSQALPVRGRRRSRREIWRRLLARHHPCQHPDQGNPAQGLGCVDRGHSGPRPVFTRLRRRQHPQRHGHPDRRHRSAGVARHPRIRSRVALPHSQRPLADGIAAQIQRGVRWRRQDRGARRHQRHRLRGGRGEGRVWCRARNLVSPRRRRHHRP